MRRARTAGASSAGAHRGRRRNVCRVAVHLGQPPVCAGQDGARSRPYRSAPRPRTGVPNRQSGALAIRMVGGSGPVSGSRRLGRRRRARRGRTVECGRDASVVEAPGHDRSGTPAWSISVAMKWRRSCSRNGRSPAFRRWRRKALVTRFGFQAATPPSSLNTKPSAFGANVPSVVGKNLAGGRVKVDDMAAFGLRGGEYRAVGAFHPARRERQPAVSRCTLRHRRPSSCARRAPVNAAITNNTCNAGRARRHGRARS